MTTIVGPTEDGPKEKPSQAEGERDMSDTHQEEVGDAQATQKPSQAEGDRETIEEDIEKQR